jgi:hypothetical protein
MIRLRRSAHLSVRSPPYAALHQARMRCNLYPVVTRVCPRPMLIRRALPHMRPSALLDSTCAAARRRR